MAIYGSIFFGFRGILTVILTTTATLLAYNFINLLFQFFRHKKLHTSTSYALWNGALAGLATPVLRDWTVPLLIGLLLGPTLYLVGRSSRIRIHPVALTLIIIWLIPAAIHHAEPVSMRNTLAQPVSAILTPNHIIIGNVTNVPSPTPNTQPWLQTADSYDAITRYNIQQKLITEQREILQYPLLIRNMLVTGDLPPLAELLFGAVPGPIGATSPILIIALGLYLIYKKHASWRTAMAALVAALSTYIILPFTIDNTHTLVITQLSNMQPAAAITFLAYFFLASPFLMLTLIFAPAVDPMSRQGRVVFGLLLGIFTSLCLFYLATPEATFIALIAAGVFSRLLDCLNHSRFTA